MTAQEMKDATLQELQRAFNAGFEQGYDESSTYEWGINPNQSRESAFLKYLRDLDRRGWKFLPAAHSGAFTED